MGFNSAFKGLILSDINDRIGFIMLTELQVVLKTRNAEPNQVAITC
jgi:hypothetical protein